MYPVESPKSEECVQSLNLALDTNSNKTRALLIIPAIVLLCKSTLSDFEQKIPLVLAGDAVYFNSYRARRRDRSCQDESSKAACYLDETVLRFTIEPV